MICKIRKEEIEAKLTIKLETLQKESKFSTKFSYRYLIKTSHSFSKKKIIENRSFKYVG